MTFNDVNEPLKAENKIECNGVDGAPEASSADTGEVTAPGANHSQPVISSVSFNVQPYDPRCRYWAKLIRANTQLPTPAKVEWANDLPVPYHQKGDEELYAGDVLFEGEANHHRRPDRGWSYWVNFVDSAGELVRYKSGFGEQKMAAKSQGLAPELLAGSGDLAGAVRVAHALRAGMKLAGML